MLRAKALRSLLVLLSLVGSVHAKGGKKAHAVSDRADFRQVAGWLGHPGFAVAVVDAHGSTWMRGFGVRNKKHGGKVTEDTVFRIASITKVFTAASVLMLRDAGALSLDEPIATYLPELGALKIPDPQRPIALRHIFTHSSGLPRDAKPPLDKEGELFTRLLAEPLRDPAGTQVKYSNLAVGLVGPIVARKSGSPFRSFLEEKIFQPLSMTHMAWEARAVPPASLATGHTKDKETDKWEPAYGEWKMGVLESFGGLYASASDLAKFARMQLAAYSEGGSFPFPEKRESILESHRLALKVEGAKDHYGIAWKLQEEPSFGTWVMHSGATDEYSASLVMVPSKGLAVVVLSNAPVVWETERHAQKLLRLAAREPRGEKAW